MVIALKHYMNPLHVYCRLRDLGIGKEPATCLCRIYERIIFKKCFLAKETGAYQGNLS